MQGRSLCLSPAQYVCVLGACTLTDQYVGPAGQAFDLRASVLEVARLYEGLADLAAVRPAVQVSTGVEILELHGPLARTLGLGALADELETLALRVGDPFTVWFMYTLDLY